MGEIFPGYANARRSTLFGALEMDRITDLKINNANNRSIPQ